MSLEPLEGEAAAIGPGAKLPGWFAELQDMGLEADSDTYSALVGSAARSGNLLQAARWAESARAEGAKLDALLPKLIEEALLEDDTAAAKVWLEQAIKSAVEINVTVADAVVGNVIKYESLSAAQQWLVGLGQEPRPWLLRQKGALRQLLKKASRSGQPLSEADAQLEQALSMGVEADVGHFRVLIHEAVNREDLEASEMWFKKAVQHECLPPISTVNAIIGLATKVQGLSAAESWFNEACQAEIQPNQQTFKYMLHAAVTDSDPMVAKAWFDRSVDSGIAPDVVAFNVLMNGAAKKRDLSTAEEWFKAMEAAHVQPDILTYNIMLSAAVKSGNFAAAEQWFARVRQAGFQPDVCTFNTFMGAAMKAARPQQVEEIFWQMRKEGMEPDRVTLETLRWAVGRQRVAELCKEAGLDAEATMSREAAGR